MLAYKGGVGKSTIAIHLAKLLNERLGNLCVIDADENQTTYDWIKYSNLPLPVYKPADKQEIYKYRHWLVDSEARPSPERLRSIALNSDLIIVPLVPDMVNIRVLQKNIQGLFDLEVLNYRLVLNRVPARPKEAHEIKKQLSLRGINFFKSEVREFTAYSKAAAVGLTVDLINYSNAKRAWRDIINLGEEILSYGY